MWRVYLDTCCINRPFDDLSQDRIRLEAEAVLVVLARLQASEWDWISSEVVFREIDETRDVVRRTRTRMIAEGAHQLMLLEQSQIERARELQALGFHAFDALHLACAEDAGTDVLLTTDTRFLRAATRLSDRLRVRVANPLIWLEEVTAI